MYRIQNKVASQLQKGLFNLFITSAEDMLIRAKKKGGGALWTYRRGIFSFLSAAQTPLMKKSFAIFLLPLLATYSFEIFTDDSFAALVYETARCNSNNNSWSRSCTHFCSLCVGYFLCDGEQKA